ncbi:hypothetical protein V5O48_013689 [Marasmius crinis-equi]|uniref:HMG box domain-containing protein n=1 Tax=Marasmius crinis-equi TaxID=585013 RepID=A0ABR3EZE1_9AGAR
MSGQYELTETYDMKARYFADMFYQGGVRNTKPPNAPNVFNAFKSVMAHDRKEAGEVPLHLLELQAVLEDEYKDLNDVQKADYIKKYINIRDEDKREKLKRPSTKMKAAECAKGVKEIFGKSSEESETDREGLPAKTDPKTAKLSQKTSSKEASTKPAKPFVPRTSKISVVPESVPEPVQKPRKPRKNAKENSNAKPSDAPGDILWKAKCGCNHRIIQSGPVNPKNIVNRPPRPRPRRIVRREDMPAQATAEGNAAPEEHPDGMNEQPKMNVEPRSPSPTLAPPPTLAPSPTLVPVPESLADIVPHAPQPQPLDDAQRVLFDDCLIDPSLRDVEQNSSSPHEPSAVSTLPSTSRPPNSNAESMYDGQKTRKRTETEILQADLNEHPAPKDEKRRRVLSRRGDWTAPETFELA